MRRIERSRSTVVLLAAAVCLAAELPEARPELTAQLVAAAAAGDAALVSELIRRGADVNGRFELDTPITAAVRHNRAEVVQILVARGASPKRLFAASSPLAGRPAAGRDVWEQCAACHTTTAKKKAGNGMHGLMERRLPGGAAPTYEALLARLNAGGGGMPAYRDVLEEQEKADVLAFIMRGDDPRVGRPAWEIAEYQCVEPVVRLVRPVSRPDTVPAPPRAALASFPDVLQSFLNTQRHLCQAQLRWQEDAAVTKPARASRAALSRLMERWRQSDRAAWQASDYDRSLQHVEYAALSAASEPRAGAAAAILAELAADLEIKAADIQASPAGLGRTIAVTVHTWKNGESGGWQVLYKPKVLEFWPAAQPEPFPELSSPATWRLPPGRYLLSARKPGSQAAAAPMAVSVGGGDKFECRLHVP